MIFIFFHPLIKYWNIFLFISICVEQNNFKNSLFFECIKNVNICKSFFIFCKVFNQYLIRNKRGGSRCCFKKDVFWRYTGPNIKINTKYDFEISSLMKLIENYNNLFD